MTRSFTWAPRAALLGVLSALGCGGSEPVTPPADAATPADLVDVSLPDIVDVPAAMDLPMDSGPPDVPRTCREPLRACGDRCLDVSEDPAHCGECNRAL